MNSMVGISWYIEQLGKIFGLALFLIGITAAVFVIMCVCSFSYHLMFDRECRATVKRGFRLLKRFFKGRLLAFRSFFF